MPQIESETAELVSVAEAQQALRVSRTMVLKLADAGTLPVAMRLAGGTRLFRRSEVERLAAARKRKGG